jgi:hypothetical protein
MSRKIWLTLIAVLSLCTNRTFAQKGKSEISVGFGTLSAYTLINKRPFSTTGVGVLTYRYYVNSKLTFGMGIGYENVERWGSFLSFVPEFTYSYMDLKESRIRVKLYGGAAAGLSVFNDMYDSRGTTTSKVDESGVRFSGQATPFGIRVGRKLAAFGEIGFGYKGTFNFGVAYRFKTERKYNYKEN